MYEKKSKVKKKKMMMRLNQMRARHMKTLLSLSRSLARENQGKVPEEESEKMLQL